MVRRGAARSASRPPQELVARGLDEALRERFQHEIAAKIAKKTGGRVQLAPDQIVIAGRCWLGHVDVNIVGLSEAEIAELIAETVQGLEVEREPILPHDTFGASAASDVATSPTSRRSRRIRKARPRRSRVYTSEEPQMRPPQAVVSASVEAGVASGLAATADMRRTGQWAAQAPNADDVLALEAEIAAKEAAVAAARRRRRRSRRTRIGS